MDKDFTVVLLAGTAKHCLSAGSGLASLNDLSGLWGVGAGLIVWPWALGRALSMRAPPGN